jgi:hypothetical protein
MKLPTPSAPYSPVYVHGESITIETEGKVLVLPSGNPNILPLNNEYTLNSNRLSIAESPFGGLKGSGSPDYCVGTVNIIEGDGVYLQDVNGQNSSKTLSAGKLKELNLLSVDTTNHSITEEFVVANTAESNNPTVISDGTTIEGWSAGTGTLTSLTTENGRIKAVGRGTASIGFKIIKTFSLAGKQFLTFKIECNTNKNLFVSISQGANRVEFRGTRFPIPENTVTSFVLPIRAPAGTTGLYPLNVFGTIDWAKDVTLYIGTEQTDQSDITFYLDDIHADVARQTTLEIQTPDNLANTSLQLYTHNGTAYQLCSTHSLDGAYSQVSQTSANCTFLDGTKLDDVYGTGAGRAVFPKGSAGDTKAGSSGNITYSENRGTDKRIGLKFNLPPSDNERTNFNKVRLKLVINYTDTVGNIVPDLSGNGNHGTIVGGVTKLNGGGLQFDGSTGYVAIKTITHTLPLTYAIKVKYAGTAQDRHEINIGIGLDFFSLYERNGQVIARTIGDGTAKLARTAPTIGTTHIIIAEFTNTYVKIFCDSSIASETVSYTQNTAPKTGPLTLGRNSLLEYTNADIYEAAVMHGVLSTAEKDIIFNQNTLSSISTLSGTLLYYQPTTQNMGSTTHVFADSTNTSYGLQNLSKPWIALYDPAKTEIDFFLHTYRPKQLEFKKDESGNIHELKLFPGNGQIYHGRVTHCNPALDSDSNLIPNFLEASIEGSITKFLQSYGMVE